MTGGPTGEALKTMREVLVARWPAVVLVVCASVAMGAPAPAAESAAFCPLAVEANPLLNETPDALQKKFTAVARDRSGYTLALKSEVEAAMSKGQVTDLSSDAQLAKVAQNAAARNAGAFTLQLTERNEIMIQGRIVSSEGKLLKSAIVSVPVKGEPILEVVTRAASKFFDSLNGLAQPEPLVATNGQGTGGAGAPPPTPPPMLIKPVEPPNPGTPLRIAGGIIGGAGIATTVAGIVIFANAPTVRTDANGNIFEEDAGRVSEVQAAQGAGMAALTAGIAVTITGALMFAFAPSAPVTAGLAPTPDGAMFAVGGHF